MKFTAAMVATLMGFAAAHNHTNGTNGTSTAAIDDASTTPAPIGVEGKASFTADISVGLTLPTNVTASDVTGVALGATGFEVPDGGCTGFNGAGGVVCGMTNGFQTVVRDTSGDAAAVVKTTEVKAIARRALASAEARKLSSANLKFSTAMIFTTDAAAQKQAAAITADTDGSAFGAALQEAVGTTYGTVSATVTATSVVKLTDGSSMTFEAAATAGAAAAEEDGTSSAFKVAASGLFVVLAALQF